MDFEMIDLKDASSQFCYTVWAALKYNARSKSFKMITLQHNNKVMIVSRIQQYMTVTTFNHS